MAKRIRLLNCNFRSASVKLSGQTVLTVVSISGPMDRIIGDSLGVTDKVYKGRQEDDDATVCGYELDSEIFGNAVIKPVQATLNGKVKTDSEITLEGVKVADVKIRKHNDDEQLLISLKLTTNDENAALHQLMHTVKKDGFNCDIIPASKTKAAELEGQLKLVNADEDDEEGDEDEKGKGKKKRGDIGVTVEG